MVPIGLIRKMYGTAAKIEEVNKTISESIQKYLSDEKLEILGDPLPKTNEEENIDFETQDEFKFSFELGLAPVVDLKINKKNKVNLYEISVDEKMINDHKENYTRRFGDFKNVDKVGEKDTVNGKIEALDIEGNPVAGEGIEDTSLAVDIIKDEEIKNTFIEKNYR
jgi:trigger factor